MAGGRIAWERAPGEASGEHEWSSLTKREILFASESYPINVVMDERDVVIAGDHIAQR